MKIVAVVVMFLVLFALVGAFFFFENPRSFSGGEVDYVDPEVAQMQLQKPLLETIDKQVQFADILSKTNGFALRPLYEAWIDEIGANGIVQVLHSVYPTCHDRGHDLGKVIFERVGSIQESLATCDDACFSGCMHGVMMEAFEVERPADPSGELGVFDPGTHVEIEDVEEKMKSMCADAVFEDGQGPYSVGDCAHGVGHALMFISDYDIDEAMRMCEFFESYPMQYYCATGGYMEYVERNFDFEENKDVVDFSPCGEHAYPAACFRYRFGFETVKHYTQGRTLGDLVSVCEAMEGANRLGCFHGIGNGHMTIVKRGLLSAEELCSFGTEDDQFVCLEGVMERLSRYHPDSAVEQCLKMDGWRRDVCLDAVANQMYSMDKSFDLYQK